MKRLDNKVAIVTGAGTRLLVPKSRVDEVMRAIVDAIPEFPVGDPADTKTVIGPMVTQKQYVSDRAMPPTFRAT